MWKGWNSNIWATTYQNWSNYYCYLESNMSITEINYEPMIWQEPLKGSTTNLMVRWSHSISLTLERAGIDIDWNRHILLVWVSVPKPQPVPLPDNVWSTNIESCLIFSWIKKATLHQWRCNSGHIVRGYTGPITYCAIEGLLIEQSFEGTTEVLICCWYWVWKDTTNGMQ